MEAVKQNMKEVQNILKVMPLYKRAYYKSGYDHQLAKDLIVQTNIFPQSTIRTEYITLYANGVLKLRAGYAWDGATGCPDFAWIIRPSAIHDAGYQLIRMGLLPSDTKDLWDNLLRQNCNEDLQAMDKMFLVRYTPLIYWAVSRFGSKAASAKSSRKVYISP
jgi:hypothetical protein